MKFTYSHVEIRWGSGFCSEDKAGVWVLERLYLWTEEKAACDEICQFNWLKWKSYKRDTWGVKAKLLKGALGLWVWQLTQENYILQYNTTSIDMAKEVLQKVREGTVTSRLHDWNENSNNGLQLNWLKE